MKSTLMLRSTVCTLGALAMLGASIQVLAVRAAAGVEVVKFSIEEQLATQTGRVCGDESGVLILARKGNDDPQAKRIKEQLTGQGCSVEVDKPDNPKEKIERTELRYFHRQDQRIAGEIVQFIRSQLKLKVALMDMVSWCEKHDCDVKTGHFEIWLAD